MPPARSPEVSPPLPGAPDPWTPSEMPPLRPRPPYLMTEMIAAEPALSGRLVTRLQADPALPAVAKAVERAATRRLPVTVTGCGTSHHAAMVIAALLADGLERAGHADPRVAAVQAFELARHVPRGGVVLAVSHEGGTAATNDALERARAAGATTALITVSDRSPGAAHADHVLATEEQDQSWCHTVGYLSPLVAGAVLHAALRGSRLSPGSVEHQVVAGEAAAAARLAESLARCERLLVVGSGLDHPAARELALKIEEGAHLAATAHELETVRHGHLAAAIDRTGLVAILADGEARGPALRDRTASVLRAAGALGMPATLIAATDRATPDVRRLAAGGAIGVPLARGLPRPVAASLAVVVPLQLLAERLARARGTNPDPIGRDDPRQAAAASA